MWLNGRRVRNELLRTRFAAEHDSLTGLPNRSALRRRYDMALRAGHRPSLILLDLDGFKMINDTYGHDAGDAVLEAVSRRLDASCPAGGLVGRLGGDEFLVVLPQSSPGGTADSVQALLDCLARPIALGGEVSLVAAASIGIALPDGAITWSSQLKRADIALYRAKSGFSSVVFFRAGMQQP
ncbi:hypothetical protein GCM10009838_79280 [Catenulispora subtropica]|uniref:GGDEF domain-containing protein n=2 Tax=Catenulispora subtropica TaxID=450798 RepID=A0ABP5EPM9_9ACTN